MLVFVVCFFTAGGRWCCCLEKNRNNVRFQSKKGKKKKKSACFSAHYVRSSEKQHSAGKKPWWVMFSPQVWTNHSKVNMLPSCVQWSENMASVLIPLFPPLAPGGHRGPQGRALLACSNRPCSAATPAAPLISTFQFLASTMPRREGCQGPRQVGWTLYRAERESRAWALTVHVHLDRLKISE